MSPERTARLDALGFEWDVLAANWEAHFAALEKFKAREGHCHVLVAHVEDGIKLGQWAAEQRKRATGQRNTRDEISPERIGGERVVGTAQGLGQARRP